MEKKGSIKQVTRSIKGTPAEQRMDAGGPAPNLTKGLAGGLQSVVEILGPQADIAAMVEEARRAESSFSKGDYLDAAGSMGLAAIAPLMMATPGSVKDVRKVTDKAVDFVEKKFPKMRESWWLDDLNTKDTVTLYHGTDVKNLKKIREEGITPDASNKTFLTPDPDTGIGYASMTGGEKTFRQVGKKAKHNPMENRVLLEIEVPKDIIFKNINNQRSKYSISKLIDPKAKDKFKPYDKKENLPYYSKTEFSIEGGVPPEFIKSISTKPDPRLRNKKTTTKKNQGGSIIERNPYSNYKSKKVI